MRNLFVATLMGIVAYMPVFAATSSPLVHVQTFKVTLQNLGGELKFPATVTPRAQGKLTSEVSGIVTSVKKNLGSRVAVNETVLFVRQIQVGMEYHDYAVRSPLSGVLAKLDTSVGQYLQAGLSAGEVIDPHRMKITLEAPAPDVNKITIGLRAEFIFDSEKIPLVVTGVSPVANPTTGTSVVELEPTRKAQLRAGLVGRATVFLPEEKGLAIPVRAIVQLGMGHFVRIVDKQTSVHLVRVTLGPLVRDFQVIHSGLQVNDDVVVNASGQIQDGDQVVQDSEVATPATS